MVTTDLAVIGAGPAGLAAALAGAELGLKVTLIDELPAPGGQYLVDRSGEASHPPISAAERQGQDLLQNPRSASIEERFETLVWHLSSELSLALYRRGEVTSTLQAGAVVLASGAREQTVPFPGWTLPGVMTVGAAQLLAKRHHLIPGRRIMLAGSGPLILPAAARLVELGAEIVGILEATHPLAWLRHGPAVWGNWDRLGEGRHYLAVLRKARVPYRFGCTVIRALGSERLDAVVVARLDAQGWPMAGTEERFPVDVLCVGFGFVPNIELSQVAGAKLHFEPGCGGWIPQRGEDGQTTVPGLFVAGEAASICGAGAAMLEGRLAALGAARRLGRLTTAELTREQAAVAGRRRSFQRFGAMLNTLFLPPPGLSAIITDATPICRCEEVTAGEVRAAIRQGAVTLDALKTRTRVGQGPCQGRTCGPILARMIAQETGRSVAEAGMFHARPPVKPVPLAALAGGIRP
jgi:NADPH-dependent 2,4-dienoyl-CoA reductase/sulfur reductase-like enzyme/bacterioferritin-associated ferredoxin